jgi:hypothetical protein
MKPLRGFGLWGLHFSIDINALTGKSEMLNKAYIADFSIDMNVLTGK